MICPKCNRVHPTEHETGDYSGSATRVSYCPPPPSSIRARIGRLYHHAKSNGFYVVIALGRNELNLEEVVVYRKYGSTRLQDTWVRPKAEFEDGRFKEAEL